MVRIAILRTSPEWKQWEVECVRQMIDSGSARIVAQFLKDEAPAEAEPRPSLLYRWFRASLSRASETLRKSEAVPSVIPPSVPIIRMHEDGAPELGTLKALGIDILLCFAKGELNPGVYRVPTYGVWEFRFGDSREQSVEELSFGALVKRSSTISAALVRRDESGAEFILKEGTLSSILHSHARQIDAIHRYCVNWPLYACESILGGYHAAASRKRFISVSRNPYLDRTPNNGQVAGVLLSMLKRKVACRFNGWFVAEHWNVGIADRPITDFLNMDRMPEIRWLPKQKHFIADPFGMKVEDKLIIMAEEYDYATDKGVIRAISADESASNQDAQPVIELPVHMSYPYLFEHEGATYCVPETYQANEAALFKAVRFPDKWEKVATLVPNFKAVDSTIFRHDGKWWLFCTDERTGANSHLHIWFASDLEGEWKPHPLNPVKMDIRSSRPAGTPFVHEGALYRPAQDCSVTYGGGMMINRIDVLNERDFREETVSMISPDSNGPYAHGFHTLSAVGDHTLVDAKIEKVSLIVFMIRLKSKAKTDIRKWMRKLGGNRGKSGETYAS